ncbi:MAG: LysR substrate-binding domain-containing protein [Myxococcota bacterium]
MSESRPKPAFPPRELPSTQALRAFVETADRGSIKAAAEALGLSPSALSRQIQALEALVNAPLFERLNPGLALTSAGARIRPRAERILTDLAGLGRDASGERAPLRLSTLESFSANWLVPHLPDFRARHPEIEIELEATLRYADLARDEADVAIRFGVGPWGDLHAEPIVDLSFFPVCSPALLEDGPPLDTPDDLARHPWIHVDQVPNAWRDWCRHVGHPDLAPPSDLRFDHVGIALSAAASGQGIALSSAVLAGPALARGELIVPFARTCPSRATYFLVCKPEALEDPRVMALRDWLVAALEAG